jgi:hypothetical protein
LKKSDDFADDCARAGLSDAAYRTHDEGLLWVMRRETGGWLDRLDLRRFAETRDPDAAVAELVAAGFWQPSGDGWLVIHGMEHQPELEVLAARRKAAAERQRRKRAKAAGLDVSRRDYPRDDPRDPGRVGSGRDGESQQTNPALEEEASPDEPEGWR